MRKKNLFADCYNGGLGGRSYKFEVPEGASKALVQDYANAIDKALSEPSYKVVSPQSSLPLKTKVAQLDWDTTTTDFVWVPDFFTHILIHENNGALLKTDSSSDTPRDLQIFQASSDPFFFISAGQFSGKVVNIARSNVVAVDQTSGDWEVALTSGMPFAEGSVPKDTNGFDGQAAIALRSGGSVYTPSSGTNRVTVTGANNLVGLDTGTNHLVSNGQDTVVGAGLV